MVSYLKQAPTGVIGDITRPDVSNSEPAMLVAVGGTTFAQGFGIPMKYVAGGIQQFNGGAEAAADFAGVLVRNAPSIAGSSGSDSTDDSVPNSVQSQDLLVRGYVTVKCWHGTPARGGAVFIQIVTNAGVPVGGFRADADGGNTIQLTATQAEWATDGVDADLNAELRIAR